MYKVMIVDDEDLIREDIINIIDWEHLPLKLEASAIDGIEALEFMDTKNIDIIITDIRMPEIDGLELINKIKSDYDDIVFIVISGYSDFEYARQAIKNGVKDYLLKPVSDEQLNTTLERIIKELTDKKTSETKQRNMVHSYLSIKKIAIESIFIDLLKGKPFEIIHNSPNHTDFDYSKINEKAVLVVMSIYPPMNSYHLFSLQNISDEIIGTDHIYMSTKFEDYVALIVDPEYLLLLPLKLKEIKDAFLTFFNLPLSIYYTHYNGINNISSAFNSYKGLFNSYYYWLINKIYKSGADLPEIQSFEFDFRKLHIAIDTLTINDIRRYSTNHIYHMEGTIYEKKQMEHHCLLLLDTLCKNMSDDLRKNFIAHYYETIPVYNHDKFVSLISDIIQEIELHNNQFLTPIYSETTNKLIHIIHSNYDSSTISLKNIAQDILFLNKDYIGKQFKKETGFGFNEYLNHYRIETAKIILDEMPTTSIKVLAEKVGYGHNYSYFSKTFKKLSMVTPKEYVDSINQENT